MKFKGFTLTELLGVIVLLGIIALIAVPIVNTTINNSKTKTYNAQVITLQNAAKKWGVENTNLLPSDSTHCNVSLAELIANGYIANDKVLDPRDSSEMTGSIEISYSITNKSYTYEYKATPNTGLANCIK